MRSQGEFGGYGFAAGAINGLRAFKVDRLGRLTGVSVRQVWTPQENTSECKAQPEYAMGGYIAAIQRQVLSLYADPTSYYQSPGAIPVKYFPQSAPEPDVPVAPKKHEIATCSCGFYAYFDGSNQYADRDTIAGVIEGYGKVTIGTRGFRAEKARIIALVIPARPRTRSPELVKGTNLNRYLLQRVQHNYPDVPVFERQSAMVAEYPTADELPTPQSDPNFWTRAVS